MPAEQIWGADWAGGFWGLAEIYWSKKSRQESPAHLPPAHVAATLAAKALSSWTFLLQTVPLGPRRVTHLRP